MKKRMENVVRAGIIAAIITAPMMILRAGHIEYIDHQKTIGAEEITAETVEQTEEIEELAEEHKTDDIAIYNEVFNQVKSEAGASGDYLRQYESMAADTLERKFGINKNMYNSFYGEQSSLESSNELFLVIDTKDKEEVRNLLEDYMIKLQSTASQRDEVKFSQYKIGEYKSYLILSLLGKPVDAYDSPEVARLAYSKINSNAVSVTVDSLKESGETVKIKAFENEIMETIPESESDDTITIETLPGG